MGTTVLIAGALFIVGLTIGGIVGRWRGQHDNKSKQLEEEVDKLRTDMNNYRDEVGEHFHKTGELFNAMTQNYREIYEHLATGAQKLSNDEANVFQLNSFNGAAKLSDSSADTTVPSGVSDTPPQAPSDYPKPDADTGASAEESAELKKP